MAIGTHGAIVVLLDARAGYEPRAVLKTHHSYLVNVDWSEDGSVLSSMDGQYNVCYHQVWENDLARTELIQAASLVKDVNWRSQNSLVGFTVQGILDHSPAATTTTASGDPAAPTQGSSIRTQALEVSPSKTLVATGDDEGNVSLYRYPVLSRAHQAHTYHSHASHVVTVRWTPDEKYVITAGGHDLAIMQWSVV